MKNQLPFCPYCKNRLPYLQAWGIHKDGEYQCPRCGKTSNIRYTKRLRTFAAIAAVLGFIIAVLLIIFRLSIQFGHVVLIMIPFFLFFLLAPFTIVLSPMKGQKKRPIRRVKPAGSFYRETHDHQISDTFPEHWPDQETQENFYETESQRENDGDPMEISSVSHSDYYSSKYDFSLFEETRQMDKVKNNPSQPKRRPAARPARRRVDPPKKTMGAEEEIDQILQDFIDE